MSHTQFRLPAEWERQSATLLAWPRAGSDWQSRLEAIRNEYRQLISTLLTYQNVVLLLPPSEPPPQDLDSGGRGRLQLLPVEYNDTWCRDYGPITLVSAGNRLALDFSFNGWGGRYPAELDNRVNLRLAADEQFNRISFRQYLFELEGGAIDSDGRGRLLINRHCLRARHRHLNDGEIDHELHNLLNVDEVMGIDIEPMPGDDTDGHIDTLARFVDTDTITFQQQGERGRDDRLRDQLEGLRTQSGDSYRLIALPRPHGVDPDHPASYANFLFVNGACLVPAYGSGSDETARGLLAELLTQREVVSVPAATMITQSGGPHCASMQIPAALA